MIRATTILVTGATDGIGLETARLLAASGHRLLLHGRNPAKLEAAARAIGGGAETYIADLSRMDEVASLADAVVERNEGLDALINNAGVFGTTQPITVDGLDVRFAVNAIAPFLLTKRLMAPLGPSGRVVNLSSAAQAPVSLPALEGRVQLSDREAYAQSKLALTMWSRALALCMGDRGPSIVAVNPGSLLGTKMVKEAFGVPGGDVGIGAEVLARAVLSDEFEKASGMYFDNDSGGFASPHPDVLDAAKCAHVVTAIEAILTKAGVR